MQIQNNSKDKNVKSIKTKVSDGFMKIYSAFESNFLLRLTLAFFAGLVMIAFVMLTADNFAASGSTTFALMSGLMCMVFVIPLIAEKNLSLSYMAITTFLVAALVYVRICMFYYVSSDHTVFLQKWIEQMRGMSLTEAMQADIGDYNMPYLYILFIISRIKINDLYLIKIFSCLFDALAAFFAMKIVGHFKSGPLSKISAYLLTLALPTVWLNSAFWGQCDVVFASLCLGVLYAVLKKRSHLATILWALAFSFKLQAIFALPILIIALFIKRIKPLSVLWIAPTFFATLLPAILCGRTIGNCTKIYFEQTQQYRKLYLNIPSIWTLVGDVNFENFNYAAIFLTGCALGLFLFLCYHWRHGIDEKKLITLFFIGALLIPFLLPRMHDRYYFLADLAALLLFLTDTKKWYVPIITVLSSYACYRKFTMGAMLFEYEYYAVALLLMLTIILKETFEQMSKDSYQT